MTADRSLLSRIEDAGLNASAPTEQRWVDGWLLRTAPGTAKRARCVQPVADGIGPLDHRLRRCLDAFRAAGLQPFVRITPFARPAGLDAHLASLGMARVDDTVVMHAPAQAVAGGPDRAIDNPPGRIGGAEYAGWIGAARDATAAEITAHATRLANSPVRYVACVQRDRRGDAVCGGQIAVEDDLAGLYDLMTVPEHRRKGFADGLCRHLARQAVVAGASTLYLQVSADNAAALALYGRLGFEEGYRYHYRTPG